MFNKMKIQDKINLIDTLSRLLVMNSTSAELKATAEGKIIVLLNSIDVK